MLVDRWTWARAALPHTCNAVNLFGKYLYVNYQSTCDCACFEIFHNSFNFKLICTRRLLLRSPCVSPTCIVCWRWILSDIFFWVCSVHHIKYIYCSFVFVGISILIDVISIFSPSSERKTERERESNGMQFFNGHQFREKGCIDGLEGLILNSIDIQRKKRTGERERESRNKKEPKTRRTHEKPLDNSANGKIMSCE